MKNVNIYAWDIVHAEILAAGTCSLVVAANYVPAAKSSGK